MGNNLSTITSICSCNNPDSANKNELVHASANSKQKSDKDINSPSKKKSRKNDSTHDSEKNTKSRAALFVDNLIDPNKPNHLNTQPETNLNYEKTDSGIDNITYENGDVYNGEVHKGIKHGKGKINFTNGCLYEGNFVNDLYEGKGKLVNENEITFEGTFVKGNKDGFGVQYNKDNTYRYDGEWKDNHKSGRGKEQYFDGSFYEGSFLNGKKHNHGKITLSNGSTYEGEFKDDKIEGKGFFKWSEDQTYDGFWKDNCLNGFGAFRKGDKLYKGYFYNDKKHGYGINYYLKNDTFMIGCWAENILSGLAIYSAPNQGEQLWLMKKNKIQRVIVDDNELEEIRKSDDYVKLENFYTMLSKLDK